MGAIGRYVLHKVLAHQRKKARKSPPWYGKQCLIGEKGRQVEVFLYFPHEKKEPKLPVMFNLHGGAWVGGDATCIDWQSERLCELLSCCVVNINYTKLDVQPFPYVQNEVADVVRYYAEHAEELGLDVDRFNLIGYSAGGHICAGAAQILRDRGFPLKSNVLVYPFLDFSVLDAGKKGNALMQEIFFRKMNKDCPMLSPAHADAAALRGLSATEIILVGKDDLYQQGIMYDEKLKEAGVPVCLKVFERAVHGFFEIDYSAPANETERIQKEEEDACLAYLKERMQALWS